MNIPLRSFEPSRISLFPEDSVSEGRYRKMCRYVCQFKYWVVECYFAWLESAAASGRTYERKLKTSLYS